MLHVWYIYLQNWVIYGGFYVGKYTSTMDDLGNVTNVNPGFINPKWLLN